MAPDIIVVVAYGCIIPPQLLHAAKYGCINLHVSLLPKYRGSAPIQWAVLNGDEGTGVTIMQLDEGVDTGDILMVEPVTIDPEETSGELFDRVSAVGAGTLVTALEKIEAGELTPRKQDNAAATMAPPLTKDMAQFDFTQDAAHIHNWVRGMNVARGVVRAGRQAHQGVGKPPGRKPAARSLRHRAGPEAADDCR